MISKEHLLEQTQKKVFEIHQLLNNQAYDYTTLFGVSGGTLLFDYHFTRMFPNAEREADFERRIHHFLSHYDQVIMDSFCNGIPGNIWLINYFASKGIIDNLLEPVSEELSDYFLRITKQYLAEKSYDFLHGALGILHTANVTGELLNPEIPAIILNAIEEDLIKKDLNSSYMEDWMLVQKGESNKDHINFGLAHGLPSAALILSGTRTYQGSKMAIEIGNFIQMNQSPDPETLSYYPYHIKKKEPAQYASRLAWCYGDPGIASAFWQMGENLQSETIRNHGLEVIKNCTKRTDLTENNVIDAGLCHGTAGMAHIFNRFYQETGINEFDTARYYWLDQTLKMDTFDDGLAGYKTFTSGVGWNNESCLIDGVTGIGLALLGFLSDSKDDIDWDNCFLLS